MPERVDPTHIPETNAGFFLKSTPEGVAFRIVDGPVKISRRFRNDPAQPLRDSYCYVVVRIEKGPDGKPELSQAFWEASAAQQALIGKLANDPDFGDPKTFNCKLSHTGSGKQTKYTLQTFNQGTDPTPYINVWKNSEKPIDLDVAALKCETGNWEDDGTTAVPSGAPEEDFDPFA